MKTYNGLVDRFSNGMNRYDLAANIGYFLISKGLKTYDSWYGKIPAKEQRETFGVYLGKGNIYVDGTAETIEMTTKVCFGTDSVTVVFLNAKTPSESFNNDSTRKEITDFIKNVLTHSI